MDRSIVELVPFVREGVFALSDIVTRVQRSTMIGDPEEIVRRNSA